jgi:hypothetical protein
MTDCHRTALAHAFMVALCERAGETLDAKVAFGRLFWHLMQHPGFGHGAAS